MNVNSLRSHVGQLRQYLHDHPSYHLFGVAETWLDNTVLDDVIRIPGYSLFRQDRNVRGGGVALYVRDSLKVSILATSDTEMAGLPRKPEYLMLSIQGDGSPPVFVSVIYRPPKIPFLLNSDMVAQFQTYSFDYSHKIIMGDLNGDLLTDSDDSKFIRKFADELSLQIVQHGSTHHTPTSHTWIDVMFADNNDDVRDYNNNPATWHSKHNIIDFTMQYHMQEIIDEVISYRDYKMISSDDLIAYLQGCDWSLLDTETVDVDLALEQLSANLKGAIDHLAPVKTLRPRKGRLPWVGTELSQLYKKRDATYRRYRRTGITRYFEEFLELRRQAQLKTDTDRSSFLQGKLFDALSNNRVWDELRSLGLLPRKKENLNGITPSELNEHFAGVSVQIRGEVADCEEVVKSAPLEGFSLKEICLTDVVLAISHFSSQARGEDGIPQSVILKSLPVIGCYVVRLFNASIRGGTFPALWKKAHVLPLNKCAAPTSPTDFRPIALLCFLSKVLEKIIHTQISDYLEKQSILDPLQTGFRQFHSTESALLKLTEDVRTGLSKRQLTLLLLFDFSKAFDMVSPARLLHKLRVAGFSRRALQWVCSYLTGREQMVISKGSGCSPWIGTGLGVPQGSVLGPLLFCVYINDVSGVFDTGRIKHILYADDLQIYIQVPRTCLEEGVAGLESAAAAVSEWAASASLRLNTRKTKAIIFGHKKYINEIYSVGLPGVRMSDGEYVPFSSTVVSLGVVLDSRFTWKPHVDAISKKFNRVLYSLRFFRQYTTETLRKRLATALLFPHLDYCSAVYLDASLELRRRLQVLQNSCVRYVYGVRRDEHITPYRQKLGWLRMDSRRDYFLYILLYKVLRIGRPCYLLSFFTKHVPKGPVRGDAKELMVPFERTELGTKSFKVKGALLWNSLPLIIRNAPSLSAFKRAVKRHLLELD